jgi:hypothetical protein
MIGDTGIRAWVVRDQIWWQTPSSPLAWGTQPPNLHAGRLMSRRTRCHCGCDLILLIQEGCVQVIVGKLAASTKLGKALAARSLESAGHSFGPLMETRDLRLALD